MDKKDRELVEKARKAQAMAYKLLWERLDEVERELFLLHQVLGTGADLVEQSALIRGPNYQGKDVRETLRTGIVEVQALEA